MARAGADVILLCGGLGTRLKGASGGRPKPMADVGGRPFLDILLRGAQAQGFKRFILCAGHKAEAVREYFEGKEGIVLSQEPRPLGTAGALKLCSGLIESRTALVMNGDSYCPLDLAAFLDFHRGRGAAATLAAVPSGGRADAGGVVLGGSGRILSYEEKGSVPSLYISAGVYALEPSVFDRIPPGVECSLERQVLPGLVGSDFYGYAAQAPLYDIGTPERLEAFRRDFLRGKVR